MDELDKRDFTTLSLCAFRYAIDRRTGISYEISNMLLRYKELVLPWAKDQIKRDIEHKIHAYGFEDVSDLENWKELKDKL